VASLASLSKRVHLYEVWCVRFVVNLGVNGARLYMWTISFFFLALLMVDDGPQSVGLFFLCLGSYPIRSLILERKGLVCKNGD